MLAAPFIKTTRHRLQVEFHRSAVGLRMARLVFSLSRNVERGVEIREGNGGARVKDARGGVKNSQRSCQEMDLV